MKVNCLQCGIEFEKRSAQTKIRRNHFCSHYHYAQYLKGKIPSNISGLIKDGSLRRGKHMSPESREKISLKKFGSIPWNKGTTGIMKAWNKGMKFPERSGNNSPVWRGGPKTYDVSIRQSDEYREWRKAVFSRDDWTCYVCRERGGELEAHHIYPFSVYPEKRLDVDNGITLCKSCHKESKGKEVWYAKELFNLQLLDWILNEDLLHSL